MNSIFCCIAALVLCADQKMEGSPAARVAEFNQSLTTGDKNKVLSFIADLPGKDELSSQLDELLKNKQFVRSLSMAKVMDSKINGKVAVVITGIEGKEYRQGIDIDPVYLLRVDEAWKIAPEITQIRVPMSDDSKELQKSVDALEEWFRSRKNQLYSERHSEPRGILD